MKKSLTILTIAILAIVAFTSCVSAASVQTSATNVKVGDTVTVTVKTNNPVKGMEFEVEYDASKYQYTGVTSDFENATPDTTEGKVFIQAYNAEKTSNSVVLTFKALEATNGKGDTFKVNDLVLVGANQEEITNNPATVAVEAAKVDGQGGTEENQGGSSQGGQQSGNNDNNNGGQKDKNGNDITEIPNAGTPIFAGAVALIAIVGAVLVIKNRK